jgi:hypothetical protein
MAVESISDPDEAVIQISRDEGFPNRLKTGNLPEVVQNADSSVVLRHCVLLTQAGLLDSNANEPDASRTADGRIFMIVVRGLTHDGHDFLDNIRDDTIWKKTKKEARSMALDVVKVTAEGIVKGAIGL